MTPTTTTEPLEIIKRNDITPVIDQVRATLPMTVIEALLQKVSTPGFSIEDEEEEARVNGYMRDCNTWAARIESGWKPVKELWFQVHKAACAGEKQTAPAIDTIRQKCQKAMADWIKAKTQRARERQADIDRAVEENRQNTARQAREAAFSGDSERAAALSREAQTMRAPVIMTGPTKLEGTAVKPVFVPTVEDLALFVKAVAEGHVSLMQTIQVKGQPVHKPVITVDESVLKFMAGKMGHQLNWPGVKVEDDISFSSRKR